MTTALILAVAAVGLATMGLARLRQTGEDAARVWFYDQKTKHLYAAARDTIPPDLKDGSGVRAVVVAFRDHEGDANARRIAYLESYTPQLKKLLTQMQVAHAAGRALTEWVPNRNSEFFQTNRLVKRLDDSEWYCGTSREARKVMSEWKSWRGPDGQLPGICLP